MKRGKLIKNLILVSVISSVISGCNLRPSGTVSAAGLSGKGSSKAGKMLVPGKKTQPGSSSVANQNTNESQSGESGNKDTSKPDTKGSSEKMESDIGKYKSYSPQEVRDMMNKGTDKKVVFLTFDDGPSENNTPKILETLKNNDVGATFFYYTKGNLSNLEDVVRKAYENGNAIGIHSNSHDYQKLYPERTADVQAIIDDANAALRKVRKVLGDGFDTRVYRFPGGSFSWKNNDAAIEAMMNIGYEFVDWNTMTGDSDRNNPDRSPEGLLNFLKESNEHVRGNCHIVLMHDGGWVDNTPEALQSIIDYYKSMDYEFAIIR